jgi:hypothetical protein
MFFKKIDTIINIVTINKLSKDINYSRYNLYLRVWTSQVYDINFFLKNINHSKFKTFFKELDIDTPYILNQINSLKRLKSLTYFKRLTSYVMRSGIKIKSFNVLLWSLINIINTCKTNAILNSFLKDWRNLYFMGTVYLDNKSLPVLNLKFSDSYIIDRDILKKTNELNVDQLLLSVFRKFNFLFSFYIYKVDKQIYKNSRGKSGKYTFIWKYVAPYKRNLLILHWLVKETRMTSGKTFKDRVLSVIKNFILDTKKTWIWKIRKFSLNYVYYNLRRTLGETYKTSMR